MSNRQLMSDNQTDFVGIDEDEKHIRVVLEDLLTNYQKQKSNNKINITSIVYKIKHINRRCWSRRSYKNEWKMFSECLCFIYQFYLFMG